MTFRQRHLKRRLWPPSAHLMVPSSHSIRHSRLLYRLQHTISLLRNWHGPAFYWRHYRRHKYEAGSNDITGNDKTAPLCPVAQKLMAGSAVESKVDVVSSVYKSDSHEFEHTRTAYSKEKNGRLALNVSGHNDYYSGITVGCLVPASDIGCKMTSSDRIAQQLNVTGNTSPNCSAMNEYVVHLATEILNQTEVGRNTLARYHARGRGIFFAPDFSPLGNIGPLFVKGNIKIEDSAKGITISSIAIKNSINSAIFPGVHYCKFVSPARVIDYMMIDSLKNASGCLNK